MPEANLTASSTPALPTIYGIPNCDQIKKTRRWLDAHHIAYQFHDFKKDGLDPKRLEQWLQRRSWIDLVNRKGTTWRKLTPAQPTSLGDALPVMRAQPSLLKRPILEMNDLLEIGFIESRYVDIFLGSNA